MDGREEETMSEQTWHRVTLLPNTKVNTPTHYICACGEARAIEVKSQPFVEGEPHSNMAHLISIWDGGITVLDQVCSDHNAARQRDELQQELGDAIFARDFNSQQWNACTAALKENMATIQELERQRDLAVEVEREATRIQRVKAEFQFERANELEHQRDLAVAALRKIKAAPWHGDPLKRIVEHEAMVLCAEEALDTIAKPGGD